MQGIVYHYLTILKPNAIKSLIRFYKNACRYRFCTIVKINVSLEPPIASSDKP